MYLDNCVCVLSDLTYYPSLVSGETHGILLLLIVICDCIFSFANKLTCMCSLTNELYF